MCAQNNLPITPYNISASNLYSGGNKSTNPVSSNKIQVKWNRNMAISPQELNELGVDIQPIKSDNSKAHYENYESSTRKVFTEGTNRRLDEIIMQKPSTAFVTNKFEKENQQAYIRDLKEISEIEGFRVVTTSMGKSLNMFSQYILEKTNPWLEDYNLMCTNGDTITKSYSDVCSCNNDINIAESFNKTMKYNVNKDCARKIVVNGGNVLTTQNSNGKTTVFINEYYLNNIFQAKKDEGADIGAIKEHVAKTLGVDVEDVRYLNLPKDHIDMHLRPGPNGVMFMNDFSLSINIINKLLSSPKYSSKLSIEEIQTLKTFKADAIKEEAVNRDYYKKMKDQLRNSGFDVISIPGVFSNGKEKESEISVNFINGITATGNKGRYFISNGSNLPILNNIFASILSNYGIDNIYFVGRNLDKTNFDSSTESNNARGGIDCRTLERGSYLSPFMQ